MRPKAETETIQETLADNETVLDGLGDGTRLVEIEETDSYQSRHSYRIETAYGEEYRLDDERRAKLWYCLYSITGGFSKPDRNDVPLEVVLEGRPAVSTYLYAVQGLSSEDVAETFGFGSKRTVWDYLSEIRGEAREAFGVDP